MLDKLDSHVQRPAEVPDEICPQDRNLTPTVTPTPSSACVGDSNSDGQVTVNELLTMVNIALGNASVSACDAGAAGDDGQITVDEILKTVHNALNGCE